MPVGESPRGGLPLRPAAATLLLLLALGLGCLNLDLPSVPATPPAPSLDILSPKSDDVINLTAQVSVAAASVDGIAQVNVLCGPPDGGAHLIYTWASAPYQALVDFSLCQDVAQRNPDAGHPLLQVQVTAISGGDAGATQQKGVDVFLNTDGPVLTVLYPPSAQPKTPFTVLVATDGGLRSFPQVLLDGLPATSVTAASGPNGLVTYSAYFQSTPGLGTDNSPYTPGVPVPIEVLTDTQRAVRLTVSATGENGNTTQVDLGVELTRVVWDRYIPGQPAASGPLAWAAQPLAFDGGLVLPLATTAPATSSSAWIPGRLDAVDGTFYGFDPALLPDGGYLAKGLNALGETLFALFGGNASSLLLAPPPPSSAPLFPGGTLVGPAVLPPLTRVDNLLCLQDSVTGCSDAGDSVTCLTPQLSTVTASDAGLTGPPSGSGVAGSGSSYLSPNSLVSAPCVGSASWNLADFADGGLSFGPAADPNGTARGCQVTGIAKLLPVGDGTFVVQLTSRCGVTAALPPEYPILRVGPGSTILGAYTAPLGTPATTRLEVVGALVDGRVVTLVNAPPYTNFELWTLNSATPDVVTSIAGLYDAADAVLSSTLALSSYSAADGSFAVLLSGTSSFGAAIAAFGPKLQPRWLYLYPRIANAGTARLVSSAGAGNIYLVDEANNRAVSLQVVPPPPPPQPDGGAACIVDGGVSLAVTVPSQFLCHDPYRATFQVTNGSCQPVTVKSLTISDTITSGTCAPFSPGTYPPTTPIVPAGQTVTVLDVVSGPFCCTSPGCPPVFDCTATNTFTGAFTTPVFSGQLAATANYSTHLGGCNEVCGVATPGAGIYVSQAGNSVLVFPFGASGNVAPVRTISGAQTGLSLPVGLGTDSQGNLYVANRTGAGVTVYPPTANGNVAPLRTLTATGLGSAQALTLGPGGDVYVSACPNCGPSGGGTIGVWHFPANSTNSDYLLTGINTDMLNPSGVALGDVSAGQPLYVANSFNGVISTFPAGATGNASPSQNLNPTGNLQGFAYASSTFFVAFPTTGVSLYPSSATGMTAPSSVLAPSTAFPLQYSGGVTVDATVTPPVVYVVDYGGNAVYVLQTAGTLPNLTIQSVTTISGTATGLASPLGVHVVP